MLEPLLEKYHLFVATISYTLLAYESYYLALHVGHDGNYSSLTGVGTVVQGLSSGTATNHFRIFRTTQPYALALPATFTLTAAMRVAAEQPSVRMRAA